MGLFWSATPVPGTWRPAPPDWVMWPLVARFHAEAAPGRFGGVDSRTAIGRRRRFSPASARGRRRGNTVLAAGLLWCHRPSVGAGQRPRRVLRTCRQLDAERAVAAGRLPVVWGASRGGELALLLRATIPAINAVIAYAASGVLHGPFEPHDPGTRSIFRTVPQLRSSTAIPTACTTLGAARREPTRRLGSMRGAISWRSLKRARGPSGAVQLSSAADPGR